MYTFRPFDCTGASLPTYEARMRFFVSYATLDGERYARRAKELLAPAHDAWVWATDRTPGVPTWREIAGEILAREIFLCVLTPHSAESAAEVREVNLALYSGKRIITLKRQDARLYAEPGGENYEDFTEAALDDVCHRIAAHIEREQTLAAQPTSAQSTASGAEVAFGSLNSCEYGTQVRSRMCSTPPAGSLKEPSLRQTCHARSSHPARPGARLRSKRLGALTRGGSA